MLWKGIQTKHIYCDENDQTQFSFSTFTDHGCIMITATGVTSCDCSSQCRKCVRIDRLLAVEIELVGIVLVGMQCPNILTLEQMLGLFYRTFGGFNFNIKKTNSC